MENYSRKSRPDACGVEMFFVRTISRRKTIAAHGVITNTAKIVDVCSTSRQILVIDVERSFVLDVDYRTTTIVQNVSIVEFIKKSELISREKFGKPLR